MPKYTATELKLDYFKFYDVANLVATGEVSLQGQFDKGPQPMALRLLDFFANPVSKNGEPMFNKNAHLTWYQGAFPAEPTRAVGVANQFHAKLDIHIGRAAGLLVPTHKIEHGSLAPEKLDHYKVYQLVEPVPVAGKSMDLKDQFFEEGVKLIAAQFFAVPVTKHHGNQNFTINNAHAHLLIYSISARPYAKTITIENQFLPKAATLNVQRTYLLAAPSVKLEWRVL